MFPMTVDGAHELAHMLHEEAHAPYIQAHVSTLGGAHRVAVMLRLSLDPQDSWTNGIFHNSRYVILHIHTDGEITLVSDSGIKSEWRPVLKKRWRKTNAKSFEDAVSKINRYLREAA